MKKICKFLSQFNAKSFVKNAFAQTVLFYSIGLTKKKKKKHKKKNTYFHFFPIVKLAANYAEIGRVG